MSGLMRFGGALALATLSTAALAAGGDLGQAEKQATNWTAITMFAVFVLGTLYITKWAASKTKSAADFYTAGGGITGFQNGLAIAGDYMSAASFLGISAAVMTSGYDGLIYSIGFLVGWPVITFLMAERLRNLGKFTFADVAAYRFKQTPIRAFAASGAAQVLTPTARPGYRHIYNQYVIRVPDRDRLRAYLGEQGVGTEIYYPVPLHMQKCFAYLGYRPEDCPESAKAASETLALPIYPELAEAQLQYVVDTIAGFYRAR